MNSSYGGGWLQLYDGYLRLHPSDRLRHSIRSSFCYHTTFSRINTLLSWQASARRMTYPTRVEETFGGGLGVLSTIQYADPVQLSAATCVLCECVECVLRVCLCVGVGVGMSRKGRR